MIEIKTYTNVWNADRKIYRFQDLNLPFPISFKQIGLFFVGAILWFPIMYIASVPLSNSFGFMIIFGPPVVLAFLGDKPIFGGKTIVQAVVSELRYWVEPKFIKDYEPASKMKENARYGVTTKIWYSLDSFKQIGTPASEQEEKPRKSKDLDEIFKIGNQTKNYDSIFKSLTAERG